MLVNTIISSSLQDYVILSKEDYGYSAEELGQEWVIWIPERPGNLQE